VNHGGEVHTFTEVEEFGGGIVPALNNLAHTPVEAPECKALESDDFIAPGATYESDTEQEPGEEKYQCCIHPWMRLTAHIRGENERLLRLARGVLGHAGEAGRRVRVAASLVLRPRGVDAHRPAPPVAVGIDVDSLQCSRRAPLLNPGVERTERIELCVEQPVAVRESRDAIEAEERVGDCRVRNARPGARNS
jgi:hypothetical protein